MITIVSEEQAIKYAKMYENGMGIVELKEQAKVGRDKMKEILISQGVKIRNPAEQQHFIPRDKYTVNRELCKKCRYDNRRYVEKMCMYLLIEHKPKDMSQVSYEHCPYFESVDKK